MLYFQVASVILALWQRRADWCSLHRRLTPNNFWDYHAISVAECHKNGNSFYLISLSVRRSQTQFVLSDSGCYQKQAHSCQFRDISRHFVAVSTNAAPTGKPGFSLILISTQMPSLRDSRVVLKYPWFVAKLRRSFKQCLPFGGSDGYFFLN